ncbi:MAG: hypothetical protein KGJ48_12260, partial [Nitrospirota bacterium]|nr:hypothetical protein [Nitrospirota bacterium]
SKARCRDVQQRAEAKLKHVEAKLRDLQSLARALRSLLQDCRAGQPTDRCPILKAMEDEKHEKGRTVRKEVN